MNANLAEQPPKPAAWVYVIPDLDHGEWKKAVQQWHYGDPSIRLQALKDWPAKEWEGQEKNRMGSKRRVRHLIAEEYDWWAQEHCFTTTDQN